MEILWYLYRGQFSRQSRRYVSDSTLDRMTMSSFEDHYVKSTLDRQAQESAEQRQRIREIRELLPKVAAHFRANPPSAIGWFWLGSERAVAWRVSSYVYCDRLI